MDSGTYSKVDFYKEKLRKQLKIQKQGRSPKEQEDKEHDEEICKIFWRNIKKEDRQEFEDGLKCGRYKDSIDYMKQQGIELRYFIGISQYEHS